MASEAEVEATLNDLISRLDEAGVERRSLPDRRTLAVLIKDLDLTYTAVFGGGKISALEQRTPSGDEDVRISVASDDLVALASGRMGVGGALLTGRLRVDAGVSDLFLLRQLF